ncbi:MAG: hypothetical protein ABIF10_06555 [Candidatus Woesearchaeota archaeon]
MQKRGQLESHAFGYIILTLIVLVVIFLGVHSVANINSTSAKTQITEFKSRFDGDVKTIAVKHASVRKYSYSLPPEIRQVCFVDTAGDPEGIGSVKIRQYPQILDSVAELNPANVFLVSGTSIEPLAVEKFRISNDAVFECLPVISGKLDVSMQGSQNAAILMHSFRTAEVIDSNQDTELVSSDGLVGFLVPAGTVATSETGDQVDEIWVEIVPREPLMSSEHLVSESYSFGPSGTTFSRPVFLTITYLENLVSDPSEVRYYDNSHPDGIPWEAHDPSENTLTFSLYSI